MTDEGKKGGREEEQSWDRGTEERAGIFAAYINQPGISIVWRRADHTSLAPMHFPRRREARRKTELVGPGYWCGIRRNLIRRAYSLSLLLLSPSPM